MPGARLPENAAGAAGEFEQRAGLHRLQLRHRGFAEPLRRAAIEAAFGGEIEHLPADHAAEPGGARERKHKLDPHRRVGVGLGPCQGVEGESQKPVAGENRGRLIVGLVYGRLAAAQFVVVHGRQVVVHQRITVHAFERRTRHQRMLARHTEQGSGLDHEERPEPLTGAEARVAHGRKQPGRASELLSHRVRPQEPVEQRLDVLGDPVEAILELHRRVHAVLVPRCVGCRPAGRSGRGLLLQPDC